MSAWTWRASCSRWATFAGPTWSRSSGATRRPPKSSLVGAQPRLTWPGSFLRRRKGDHGRSRRRWPLVGFQTRVLDILGAFPPSSQRSSCVGPPQGWTWSCSASGFADSSCSRQTCHCVRPNQEAEELRLLWWHQAAADEVTIWKTRRSRSACCTWRWTELEECRASSAGRSSPWRPRNLRTRPWASRRPKNEVMAIEADSERPSTARLIIHSLKDPFKSLSSNYNLDNYPKFGLIISQSAR